MLCDRFTDATYAYQGYGRAYDLTQIETLERLVQGTRQPDITFLFDIEPSLGLARAQKRSELDRFEREHLDFFQKVREGYLQRASNNERFKLIDAAKSEPEVEQQLTDIMRQWSYD